MFESLLIANRGEIACRIIRTARRLGIRTIAVYSEADRDALHVAMADEAYCIGPAAARDSYLDAAKIIAVARRAGAHALHPGYGFLSENAAFAEACTDAGITFVGPPAAAIRAMGGKSEAKALMAKAGVPLVPGYHGAAQDPAFLGAEAQSIGYPVLIKASAGGGGKGMKVAETPETFAAALASAQREAKAAFGDDRVLVERYLERPRHVEIQVFADSQGHCVYLFERDCSIQRRHQKVIEEAPAPDFPVEMRHRMGEAAVAAARAIGYVGAGTVEFLYAPGQDAFFFMEMNTRLQVEHPVTEMITGLDLVEWQLQVAAGAPLPLRQDDLAINGHAIEVRLYAEDPDRDFLPQTGRLRRLDFPPQDTQTRVDAGVRSGDAISIFYDPMIAKLIVWGADRPSAIRHLRNALAATHVVGLKTNLRFLAALAAHPAFGRGELDTGFIARHHDDLLAPLGAPSDRILAMATLGLLLERRAAAAAAAAGSADPWSPWAATNAWRLNLRAEENVTFRGRADGAPEFDVGVATNADVWCLRLAGTTIASARGMFEDGVLRADLDGDRSTAVWARTGDDITILDGAEDHHLTFVDPLAVTGEGAAAAGRLNAPMPGRIIALLSEPGRRVEAGEPLLVLEAMKMEHTIKAPVAGLVAAFRCAVGDQVAEGLELVVFEPE